MTDLVSLQEVTLVLPMDPEMELVAGRVAGVHAAHVGMSADRVDEVRMAVVEACINAFEHSHAEDPRVELTFRVLGDVRPVLLEIRVHDDGIGFAPEKVETPHLADKITGQRKRGWGLRIIQGLMDEVRIESGSGGTTVIMSKLRRGGTGTT